ncbi:MAG: DUF3015 family protein [Gammaproteobacteria bacterium]|jgi:hypothetical protein
MKFKTMKAMAVASILGASLVSGNANAAKEFDFQKIYVGCGLGGMIGAGVEDQAWSRGLAISTNITWDLGTTASISYYSSDDTCYNNKAVTVAFINQSFEQLEKEIAMGKGKYFDALTTLAMGPEGNSDEYQAKVRAQFADVVADESYLQLSRLEKVEKLYYIAI